MYEIWKAIDGYGGRYQVSTLGNARSYTRGFWVNLKSGKHPSKYGVISPSENGKSSNKTIHRLVAQAFLPNPNDLPVVMHKDDNPSNNHINNLRWGTYKDNTQDMINKGRDNRGTGEFSGTNKLTLIDSDGIKDLIMEGRLTQKEISKLYNISRATISQISLGNV